MKLKRLARTGTWVARWVDPATGREKQQSLSDLGCTTEEARTDRAVEIARRLQREKEALATGKRPETRTSLQDALQRYLSSLVRKRPTTVALYAVALKHLTTWAAKAGLSCIEDLDPLRLNDLSRHLHHLKAKRRASGKGTGRGALVTTKALLAPASVNQFVRGLRTFLGFCRREDLTPRLTSDAIRDHLPFAKRQTVAPHFLKAREVRALLEACGRHDTATYKRHRWQGGVHYPPILPFVAAALLTGCRFAELANLRWADVDLEAGEINLSAGATKTGHARRITLKESPALWALLERLKLQAAGREYVFGGNQALPRAQAEAARKRLVKSFGAPRFDWHDLRRTCGTFLTCAPAIFGAASAFMSAKRLGHSVTVAERLYVGAVDVAKDATSLEAAMGVADLLPAKAAKPAKAAAKPLAT